MYDEFPFKDTIERKQNFDTEYITHLTQILKLKDRVPKWNYKNQDHKTQSNNEGLK